MDSGVADISSETVQNSTLADNEDNDFLEDVIDLLSEGEEGML